MSIQPTPEESLEPSPSAEEATARSGGKSDLLISCEGVERIYGSAGARTVALRGIDLQVRRGEILAIMGPSGCGKSTLLHILGGMDRPDAGRVLFAGADLKLMDDRRASAYRRDHVGFVFQFFNLIPTLSVLENVALPARLAGLSGHEARSRSRHLLSRVTLAHKADATPEELSGGQQQRVAIARALVNAPDLVLADEPTGALDQSTGQEVLALLASVVREEGPTLVMATHSDAAVAVADRRVQLADGRIQPLLSRSTDIEGKSI